MPKKYFRILSLQSTNIPKKKKNSGSSSEKNKTMEAKLPHPSQKKVFVRKNRTALYAFFIKLRKRRNKH